MLFKAIKLLFSSILEASDKYSLLFWQKKVSSMNESLVTKYTLGDFTSAFVRTGVSAVVCKE